MSAGRYYTLLSRDMNSLDSPTKDGWITGNWTIEFGDYVRTVVTDELIDRKYEANTHGLHLQFQIIATGDRQADIEEAVRLLNA